MRIYSGRVHDREMPTAGHFPGTKPYRLPLVPAWDHAAHGPKTRRLRDRTTAFPCSTGAGRNGRGRSNSRGPKWSPAKRVHLGEEEQGSGPNFRRQAEMEGSGLCDDDSPPYWKYPPSSSTATSVSAGGLRCHAAGAGGGCAAAEVEPWAQQQSIFDG